MYDSKPTVRTSLDYYSSWNAENTTPSLAIYDDRIVFQNPGAFPLGMTWKDFVNDQIGSLPANPTIANVFYRRGTMEAWGRGLGLIMESCREQGLPAPEIKVIPPFVNLTICFKQALTGSVKTSAPQVSDNDFAPSHHETNDQSNIITPQYKVFEFCKSPKRGQ